jgi:SAM-dependent methyltransferase
MAALQEAAFGRLEDYERGSPHLLHPGLRNEVINLIRGIVLDRFQSVGRCRVLEVGAGHGAFTDHVLATGAEVVMTDMSLPSINRLRARVRNNPHATVVHDPDGEQLFNGTDTFDVVLCVSVLHHIPDYLEFLLRVTERIQGGGALLTYQDPLFYPRQGRLSRRVDRAAFIAWRVWQGEIRRGVATQIRRWRGRFDESLPGDMVEYHVVRQGLDEEAVVDLLSRRFQDVSLSSYWSTPSRVLQAIGSRTGVVNSFSVVARNRLATGDTRDGPAAD